MQKINETVDIFKEEQKMFEECASQLLTDGEKFNIIFDSEKQIAQYYSSPSNRFVMGSKLALISQISKIPGDSTNVIWNWSFSKKSANLLGSFIDSQKELFGSLKPKKKIKLDQKMVDYLCALIKNHFDWKYILITPNITDPDNYFIFGFFDFVF